jgi:hypothetical protein
MAAMLTIAGIAIILQMVITTYGIDKLSGVKA